jgi:hypothetical protein
LSKPVRTRRRFPRTPIAEQNQNLHNPPMAERIRRMRAAAELPLYQWT